MKTNRRIIVLSLLAAGISTLPFTRAAFADDWLLTGTSMRTYALGPFTLKVYAIRHDTKGHPPRSKQAVIDWDMDKKLTWKMLRDVDSSRFQKGMRESFALNAYGDAAKISAFVGAFSKDQVRDGSAVTITYHASRRTTTIAVADGSTATIEGQDFMKAVWSIYFGKTDQPVIGDDLIANL